MSEKDKLERAEFANLTLKVNNAAIPVDYFRKNLFNATLRDSYDLKRKKIIYDDGDMTIRCDRSLNQRHRDLFSLLGYEKKGKIAPDGSYVIKTSLYKLAKKMGYKYPVKDVTKVKRLLEDLQKTLIEVKQGKRALTHTLLGPSYYDERDDRYIIKIPADTSRYLIYSYAMAIPKEIMEKIVLIKSAYLKATISHLLSHKPTKNGIGLKAICGRLEINGRVRRSRFRKEIRENVSLLRDFGIDYDDETQIFLVKEKTTKFYHALDNKQLERGLKDYIGKWIESEDETFEIVEIGKNEEGKYYIVGANLFEKRKFNTPIGVEGVETLLKYLKEAVKENTNEEQ
jgi:hypothetical protein